VPVQLSGVLGNDVVWSFNWDKGGPTVGADSSVKVQIMWDVLGTLVGVELSGVFGNNTFIVVVLFFPVEVTTGVGGDGRLVGVVPFCLVELTTVVCGDGTLVGVELIDFI
tara:strand:- start:5 stop:334 length:330 start_codon:yes stop_codon:yes gene_type:complete